MSNSLTHREQLEAMLKSAGITDYERSVDSDGQVVIDVERGYIGFHSVFVFGPFGDLRSLAAEEG